MRTLLAICAVQSALLLYLLLAPGETPTPHAVPAVVGGAFTAPAQYTGGPLDEARLRQIIREELAAAGQGGGTPDRPTGTRDAGPRDRDADQQRLAAVEARIQRFRSVGRIDEQQMQELQREIALLDGAGQRAALSQLMRAMNAREIQAQL